MPLDKLDIKIQEAAKDFKPGSGEEAWLKMEALLDVHMPQKDNDRKRIAWLFLLLFSVTAILLMLIKTWSTEGHGLSYPTENIINTLENVVNNRAESQSASTEKIQGVSQPGKNKPATKLSSPTKVVSSAGSPTNGALTNTTSREESVPIIQKSNRNDDVSVNKNNVLSGKDSQTQMAATLPDSTRSAAAAANQPDKPAGSALPDSSDKPNTTAISKSKNKPVQGNKKFNNSFVLNVSAGPDVSAVNPGNIGKINPVYGVGIGYNVAKRWQLRSGFYVTKKAYKAEASDYHPPAEFWTYYPDLEYIDANCNVYEVPLILNYNFSKTSKHLWFGSAGISSYFMKKEKYYYFPKDAAIQYAYNTYTVNNKNKHFLSSLRLSGGYAATLNKNVSLIAEPYVNLPLSGVGFGKVKLYSAGILFTLSVKPFAKK